MTKFEARCAEIEIMKNDDRLGEALVAACKLLGGGPAVKLKKLIESVNAIEEVEGELPATVVEYRNNLRDRVIKFAVSKLPRDAFNCFYYSLH